MIREIQSYYYQLDSLAIDDTDDSFRLQVFINIIMHLDNLPELMLFYIMCIDDEMKWWHWLIYTLTKYPAMFSLSTYYIIAGYDWPLL